MKTEKIAFVYDYSRKYYPFIFILLSGLFLYGRYIICHDVIFSVGAIARYDVWDFLLKHNTGWINFFKHRGEFIGGDPNYGMLNPLFFIIRQIKFLPIYSVEAIVSFIYFASGLMAMYFFLRQNGFAKWSSIFGSGVYIMNGFILKSDQNTALGISNFVFLPILFLIAQKGLSNIGQYIAFIVLCFIEFSFGLPSILFWQLIFVFIFVLIQKNKKIITRYLILQVFVGLAMLPQFFLTASLFKHDTRSLFPLNDTIVSSGLVFRDLIRMAFPFFTTSPQPYITAILYFNPIAIGLVVFAIYNIMRNFKMENSLLKFFVISCILAFVGTLAISPFQPILEKIPIANKLLARHPFRHSIFVFFTAGYLSCYAIEFIAKSRDRIKKFFNIGGSIGIFVSSLFILATTTYYVFDNKIYNKIELYYISHNLSDPQKMFPSEYYLVRIKNFFNFTMGNISLLSLRGLSVALPFLFIGASLIVMMQRKNEPKGYFFKRFTVISALLPVLVLSQMLGQQQVKGSEIRKYQQENRAMDTVIKNDKNYRNSYVLAYGVGPEDRYRDDYYRGLYDNKDEISVWMKENHYLKASINYDSSPDLIGAIDPFSSFSLNQLETYTGCLERRSCRQKDKITDGFENLKMECTNNRVDGYLDFCQKNLAKHLGLLANNGVAYIVSSEDYEIPDLDLVEKYTFDKESDILKGEYPVINLYKLKNPGNIVFIPSKIKYENLSSYDIMDFEKIKMSFDDLSINNVTTIEKNNIVLDEMSKKIIAQQTGEKNIDNIVFGKNLISFDYSNHIQSQVVVNVNYYDGWTAYIDGMPVPIDRANYNFLSVQIPSGDHKIVFKFSVSKMIKYYVLNAVHSNCN